MNVYNLISLLGIFGLLGVAWCLSSDRKRMNWRLIVWGVVIQIMFALFIFHVPAGIKIFHVLNDIVVRVLSAASAGTEFVFGRLALPPGTRNAAGEESIGFILAFQAFPAIIFFSALISILYYFKVMQFVVKGFSILFTKLLRLSGAESLVAASNIFVGVESAFTVRPYLAKMTRSEFCVVLTAGMATVASNVLVLYVSCLKNVFPAIAAHLVSASILSAPAALVMAKIILPETETPETLGLTVEPYYERENSLFEAIINGANAGVKLIVGIVALLMAVLGLVALVDLALGWAGGHLNALFGINVEWSLPALLGYFFLPFTVLLGVPVSEAFTVSKLIGMRSIITEVPAYLQLAKDISAGAVSPRSAVITTYALCGFAHVASMAIFVGGVSALVPEKTRVITGVGLRGLVAATLACLLTACVAGLCFTPEMETVLFYVR